MCTARRFITGRGVFIDADGNLKGVSVNSRPGAALEELSANIPNRQIGVTTVGDVEAAGGTITAAPTPNNSNHCVLGGIAPTKAEELFTPTIPNPNVLMGT
jgi:hypothetical protein